MTAQTQHSNAATNGNNGSGLIPAYTQQFFLALARQGRGAWNSWRENNFDIEINFDGIDFREFDVSAIDFSQFIFGDRVTFCKCQFGDGPSRLRASERRANFHPGMAQFFRASFGNEVKFTDAIFGDSANFAGATFGNNASFRCARFGSGANFKDARFGRSASFFGVSYGDRTIFANATFGDHINLNNADFGDASNFKAARFSDQSRLNCITFGDRTCFEGIKFGDHLSLAVTTVGEGTNFRRAEFGGGANLTFMSIGENASFCEANFGGDADFEGAAFGNNTDFIGARFRGLVSFRPASPAERNAAVDRIVTGWPDEQKAKFESRTQCVVHLQRDAMVFNAISFASASFDDTAQFGLRKFNDCCEFRDVTFNQPPDFSGCRGIEYLNMYGAKIRFSGKWGKFRVPGWTADGRVSLRLRALRKLAEETKNHDLERDLYIEERKAERGIVAATYARKGRAASLGFGMMGHGLWILAMGAYWLAADYGRSFFRPILTLVTSVFIFFWAYSQVLSPPANPEDHKLLNQALIAFTIANAVPLIGTASLGGQEKGMLMCGIRGSSVENKCNAPLGFQIILVLQSIVSALLFFFIGFSLQKFFKMR